MKSKYTLVSLLCLILITACSKNDDGGDGQSAISQFTSQLCSGISGPKAAYWDYSHGIPIPLTQNPTIANPGAQFIHSQYPALGFTMPQGYRAGEIFDNATAAIGVNVIRNDDQVLWRYLVTLRFAGQVPNDAVIASEINSLMDFYGANGTPTVRCREANVSTNGTLITTFGSRLIEFNNITANVWVNTHYEQTLDVTFVAISVSSAPTAEYDNEVMETFLPISWQLLYISNDVRDSDLDGTPDNQDNFPFDPNRQ
ncbi:MAG: hypothetical protein AAF466_01425 [Bacteroidota bacterium]